ncbi:MAG: D-alanyl-D-alanine carboxypeptidase family protein [Neptuniibacter sp.]
MFNKVSKLLSVVFLVVFSVQAKAVTPLIPAEPQIAATSYLVMDADTGKIIAAKNEHGRFEPASLTKMMTAYILEYELSKGNVSKDDLVLVSEKAWRTQGSRMFIREGTQVSLYDLMKGIVIQSGNDASVAVAEHIAGSEAAFADLMNQHASLLGMKNSHFLNSTGLPNEDHVSSAYDLALLAKAIIQDFPEHYDIYSEKYFTYNKIRQPNRNKLLWRDKTVDGLKTGYTKAAGYCLVASAKRDNMRLISVVLGTADEEARARESQKLLSYAFRYYRTHKLFEKNILLNTSKVWAGEVDQVRMGITEDLSVTIPRGQADNLEASMDVERVIKAPLVKGQQVGTVKVTLDGQVVKEVPLVAMDNVAEAGFLKKIWHAIMLFFTSLIG